MQDLTTDLVGRACSIFLALAYPAGEGSIPPKRRLFLALPPGRPLADYLNENADARALTQPARDGDGNPSGCTIRLGCAHFPHLKLKVQRLHRHADAVWVFSVDTHDAFSKDSLHPPPGHPEAAAWMRLQVANRELKERIEHAWQEAHLVTFNSLLREDLNGPAAPSA